MEMRPNCNVHILNCRPLHPPTRVFQCLDPPNSSGTIEPKEVQEHAIYLLLHLEVEAKIDVLQSSQ
jgi:hypothetical protein